MTRKTLRRLCLIAGLAVAAVTANAFGFDTRIVIDRAVNSPNLTIRYSGATVAIVELKLNGQSLGTKNVSDKKAAGEASFTLDLKSLVDGDNTVEVCLYDKDGKLVGSERSVISTGENVKGPIFLEAPKVGSTVQGPVEIKVGFGRELRNAYVSFFVNNQFKAMMNSDPFSYIWDTTRETNGWHEIEAWVIDENNNTLKTRKTKVFVNNPGGRTDRNIEPRKLDLEPKTGGTVGATGTERGMKPITGGNSTAVTKTNTGTQPAEYAMMTTNPIKGATGNSKGVKSIDGGNGSASGPKLLTPTGKRVAKNTVPKVTTNSTARNANTAAPITIGKGQKLPNLGAFMISYNSQFVDFDVNPRVENGIPLTPFRHLLEKAGGEVNWKAFEKAIEAKAQGREIWIQIGDKTAKINNQPVEMEVAPFIERGRTIVPLSFIRETLNVDIEFDPNTGHVLIKKIQK